MVSLAVSASATQADTGLFVVADFNQDNQNQLGGYHNKFERAPSSARAEFTDAVFRGGSGKSLQIQANKQANGFCGAWMHFFDFRADNATYFDTRPYAYLSLWVKGEEGGETFVIKLAALFAFYPKVRLPGIG